MKTMRWMVAGASVAMVLASCSGDDGGSGSTSAFCKAAQEAQDTSESFSAYMSAGEVPDSDQVKKSLEELINKAKAALKVAPAEIKDDIQTVIDGSEDFQTLFEKYDYDLLKTAQDEDFQKQASNPDRAAAVANLDKYLASECGISTSDATTPSSDTTGTTGADTTEASTDNTAASGSFTQAQIEAVKKFLPKLDDDQIRCLLEKGMGAAGGAPDPNAMANCNIDMADIVP